jgi:Asp-tRNA(Asn)/Glu-tRNA(Gln) amidotransferase A subunit family amidase
VRGNNTSDQLRLPNWRDSLADTLASAITARIRLGIIWRSLAFLALALLTPGLAFGQTNTNPITRQVVLEAEKLIGLDFSEAKIDLMLADLKEQLVKFEALHRFAFSNDAPPAVLFNPIPLGMKFQTRRRKFKMSPAGKVKLPANLDDLAFFSVGELAALIKTRQITSERLTRFYLERLKKYGPKLECVVTLTEDVALQQARRVDAEIATGKYRGPLHGIPYGAKDLLAVKGIRTTWGAAPYTNQVFDYDATVIKRLEAAGAVLVAKTTLGELAMGDVWFGGMTRNPWNAKGGSSGSSAGSTAATAAGLIPFGIGSETYGSIVSPCDRCGATGLRPTYGRVSRVGAMPLSWSMDKIGPICRTVEDCAIVFNAIHGPDGLDQSVYDLPFNYDPKVKLNKLRIGYLKGEFEQEKGERKENDEATLQKMRVLGVNLIPVELPDYPLRNISFVLSTEAAAAFDVLTRSNRDDLLKQQDADAWPNTFRQRRFVPAVEYLQAQRLRYLLIQDTAKVFDKVDLILAPSLTGRSLLLSNLTGHPGVVVPNGFTKAGTPTSICFIGKLFGEGQLLAVAKQYQDATDFHRQHPVIGNL